MLTGRAISSLVAAAATTAALGLLPASPAAASSHEASDAPARGLSGCVRKKEFEQVRKGWTATQVARTFGTSGRTVSTALASEIRKYQKCGGDGWVIVNYQKSGPRETLKVASRYW